MLEEVDYYNREGKSEYFSPDLTHYRLPDKMNFDRAVDAILQSRLSKLAELRLAEENRRSNMIRIYVRMPDHNSVQLKVNTRSGVVLVTDTKNGDISGEPWKILKTFEMKTSNTDVIGQAIEYIEGLIKPIEEFDKGLSEALELLDSVGYVCEKYRGDDYVSDHLMDIEVPGLVHSCVSGTDHYFDSEEDDDYEAQLVIYSELGRKRFRAWCRIDQMKESLSEKGELPDFFWKKSSYKDGELSRVSRWIKRKIETLRRSCLLREEGDK